MEERLTTAKGLLTSVSHVVETKTSAYFVVTGLSQKNGKTWMLVVAREHEQLFGSHGELLASLGCCVVATHLRRGSFVYAAPDGRRDVRLKVFKSCPSSGIKTSPDPSGCVSVRPPDAKQHYVGVVTDDGQAQNGVYWVDKTVLVVLMHGQVQWPVFRKGQRVHIANGHRYRAPGHSVIVGCARTAVHALDSTPSAESHAVLPLDDALGFKPVPWQMLALTLALNRLQHTHGVDGWNNARLVRLLARKMGLKAETQFCLFEMTYSPHQCSAMNLDPEAVEDVLWTVADIKNKLSDAKPPLPGERFNPSASALSETFLEDKLLFCHLQLNPETGHWELADATGTLTVLPSKRSCSRTQIVQVQRLGTYLQEKHENGCLSYVTADVEPCSGLKKVDDDNDEPWRVLYKSGVVLTPAPAVFLAVKRPSDNVTSVAMCPDVQPALGLSTGSLVSLSCRKTALRPLVSEFAQVHPSFDKTQCLEVTALSLVEAASVAESQLAYGVEELDAVHSNEPITVAGTLRDRWREKDKFGGSGEEVWNLKLAAGKDSCSLYVSKWRGPPPLGLASGAKLLATNVVKKVSQQGRIYLKNTPFTELNVLDVPPADGQPPTSLRHLRHLVLTSSRFPVFRVAVSVVDVVRVKLNAVCRGCQTPLAEDSAKCPYLGCGFVEDCAAWDPVCSATLAVQDATFQANLYVTETKVLQQMLPLETVRELDYPSATDASPFYQYCDFIFKTTHLKFLCTVRPMKSQTHLNLILLNATPM